MLRLRSRRDSHADDDRYQCCLCLHVRTGTILLGIIQIIFHLIAFGFLLLLIFSPEALNRFHAEKTTNKHEVLVLPSNSGDHEPVGLVVNGAGAQGDRTKQRLHQNVYLTLAQVFLSFFFSCMLLHGALRQKPYYLLPYFGLQVLDFVLVCLGVIQSVTYMTDVRLWIHDSRYHIPYKHHLVNCNYRLLVIFAAVLTFLIIAYKAYLIGMVWSCYKYLVLKRANLLPTSRASTDLEVCITRTEPVDSGTYNPPKYEEVLKTPANANMPPPYYEDGEKSNPDINESS